MVRSCAAVRAQIATFLSDPDLDELIAGAQIKSYPSGAVIFKEGDDADGLHLIRRGSVTISRVLGGKEVVLSYVAAGNYVVVVDTTTLPGNAGQLTNSYDPDGGAITVEELPVCDYELGTTEVLLRVTDEDGDQSECLGSVTVIDGVRRARFRDSWEREVFMKSGEVSKVAFDVGYLSQVFNRGHRIRISVSSTGAPFYTPNPQTGEPLTYEPPSKMQSATQTLHHAGARASRIFAPVQGKSK